MEESATVYHKNGTNICVSCVWRGKYYTIQMFFPTLKRPNRQEVNDAIQKVYPGAKMNAFYEHPIDKSLPIVQLPEASQEGIDKRAQLIARRQFILDRQKLVLRRKEMNADKKNDKKDNLEARTKEKEQSVTRSESLIRHMKR